MGRDGRGNSEVGNKNKSRQTTPLDPGTDRATSGSPNQDRGSPDRRRRALIAGLATTPVLLSLTNRSALGFDVNCSAFGSLILGGSPHGLPDEINVVPDHALQNMYEAQCKDGGSTSNIGATGNSQGNSHGNASGNSNH